MHIEVDCCVMPGEVDVTKGEDFSFDGDGIKDKF